MEKGKQLAFCKVCGLSYNIVSIEIFEMVPEPLAE